MKLTFYTPVNSAINDFGAATLGFVGADDANIPAAITAPFDLRGDLIYGSYAYCLDHIPDKSYQLGVVFTGNAGRENEFIRKLSRQLNVPLVGGGAAINTQTGENALLYGRSEVALFLVQDERYVFRVECENIHNEKLGMHQLGFIDPRVLDTIDGKNAVDWLRNEKSKWNLQETDFEHLTFADRNGVNAHLSIVDGKVCSGRDLEPVMELRYLDPGAVQSRMEAFYDDPTAIVFGCAGLKGILSTPLQTAGVGLFLFGEVCTVNGIGEFGNLMLSKLCIKPK